MKIKLLLTIITLLFFIIGCIKKNEVELNLQCGSNETLIDGKCTINQISQNFHCINIPENATICLHDDHNLPQDTVSTLTNQCGTNACEYTCNTPGHIFSNNRCEPTSPSNLPWQKTLENNFDIVETFDQLQDWRGGNYRKGRNLNPANMPIKTDGTISIWNMFDYWSTDVPTNDFIKNHGTENVWRGTGKSLIMSMGNNGSGINRFGTYFGGDESSTINPYNTSGSVSSGYKNDVYIFQMIKFLPNVFPKKDDGTNAYYSYFKWWVISTGNTAANICTEGRDDCTYGASNAHTMLYNGSATNSLQQFKLSCYNDADWFDFPEKFQMWKPSNTIGTLDHYIDNEQWFALEIHVHMGTPGQYDAYQEQWIYNNDGQSYYVGKSQNMIMMTSGYDWGLNYFFQGGNISYLNLLDPQGLSPNYYIDDLILDNERIGEKYFLLIKQ